MTDVTEEHYRADMAWRDKDIFDLSEKIKALKLEVLSHARAETEFYQKERIQQATIRELKRKNAEIEDRNEALVRALLKVLGS